MAGNHDFNIDQGTTWNRIITITQDGAPVNLTGFTARMQLRRTKSQSEAAISLSIGEGITITPLTGDILIELTAAQTASLSGIYFYDLELVSGPVVSRCLEGKVFLCPEVTR